MSAGHECGSRARARVVGRWLWPSGGSVSVGIWRRPTTVTPRPSSRGRPPRVRPGCQALVRLLRYGPHSPRRTGPSVRTAAETTATKPDCSCPPVRRRVFGGRPTVSATGGRPSSTGVRSRAARSRRRGGWSAPRQSSWQSSSLGGCRRGRHGSVGHRRRRWFVGLLASRGRPRRRPARRASRSAAVCAWSFPPWAASAVGGSPGSTTDWGAEGSRGSGCRPYGSVAASPGPASKAPRESPAVLPSGLDAAFAGLGWAGLGCSRAGLVRWTVGAAPWRAWLLVSRETMGGAGDAFWCRGQRPGPTRRRSSERVDAVPRSGSLVMPVIGGTASCARADSSRAEHVWPRPAFHVEHRGWLPDLASRTHSGRVAGLLVAGRPE